MSPLVIWRIVRNQLARFKLLRVLKDSLLTTMPRADDPSYNFAVFNLHRSYLTRNGMKSLKGSRILEIGPGGNIGNAVLACAFGAEHVYCVDNYNHLKFQTDNAAFYQRLLQMIDEKRPANDPDFNERFRDVVSISGKTVTFNSDRITYLAPYDAASIPLPDASVDWLYSQAVLEHVDRPAAVAKEFARLLRPGGFTSHQIDLRDHFDMSSLEMLKHSDRTWRMMASNSHGYVNRCRKPQFDQFFRQAGFQIVESVATDTIKDLSKIPARVDAAFHDVPAEELKVLGMFILGRRSQ